MNRSPRCVSFRCSARPSARCSFTRSWRGCIRDRNESRTLQYLTFPVLFPHWFLIYTGLWSLSAILLALQKRYFFSCLAITLAALIRQPAILLGVAFVIFAVCNHGITLHDREAQTATVNPTSLWFFLLIFAVLFLPQGVAGLETA